MNEHRCANCYVAQYQMKSDVPCKNEWWADYDAEMKEQLDANVREFAKESAR